MKRKTLKLALGVFVLFVAATPSVSADDVETCVALDPVSTRSACAEVDGTNVGPSCVTAAGQTVTGDVCYVGPDCQSTDDPECSRDDTNGEPHVAIYFD